MESISSIENAIEFLLSGQTARAAHLIQEGCPHIPIVVKHRRYTTEQKMQLFYSDGFIDRYSGERLLNPGVLKVLSHYCPDEFPYHPHWKMTDTHAAYWELTPTVDHIIPVALGGVDDESNWATTSMLHNQIKNIWTLEQLNWSLHERGDIAKWDGLTRTFMQLVERDGSLMNDSYIKRWFEASKNYF